MSSLVEELTKEGCHHSGCLWSLLLTRSPLGQNRAGAKAVFTSLYTALHSKYYPYQEKIHPGKLNLRTKYCQKSLIF